MGVNDLTPDRKVRAAPEKALGAVMCCIGLASLGVLAWATRKATLLDRALDAGDVAVFSVFAIFGLLCLGLGWRLLRTPPAASELPSREEVAPSCSPMRITLSHGCATAGVLLLILSVLVPAHWHPVVLLFAGLALLAASHALTPCVERIEKLRKARASMRHL